MNYAPVRHRHRAPTIWKTKATSLPGSGDYQITSVGSIKGLSTASPETKTATIDDSISARNLILQQPARASRPELHINATAQSTQGTSPGLQ